MEMEELKITLRARLMAQSHLIAVVLATVHRERPDAAKVLDEIGRSLTKDFMEISSLSMLPPSERNALTAEYTEEMSGTVKLAMGLVKRMGPG